MVSQHPKSAHVKPPWLAVVAIYLAAVIILVALEMLTMRNGEPRSAWEQDDIFLTRQITAPDWGWKANLLLNGWYRWDTGWYLKIAALGYDLKDGSTVFPPLYPLLIRWVAALVGKHYLLAALLVSNIFFLTTLLLFYQIAQDDGFSPTDAQRAVIYLVSFPTAFFLFAAYSESLFMALTLAAWLLARRERWLAAGLLAGLASLTRLQGWLLIFPLGWLVLVDKTSAQETPLQEVVRTLRSFKSLQGWRDKLARLRAGGWAVIVLPVLALVAFMFWLQSLGLGEITHSFSTAWETSVVTPWQGLAELVHRVGQGHLLITDWIDLGLFVLFLVLSLVGLFRFRPDYSLYVWATLSLMLMRGYGSHLMPGFMRYLLTLFPIFLLMAKWGRWRIINLLLLPTFLIVQLLLVWLFLNWFWVA